MKRSLVVIVAVVAAIGLSGCGPDTSAAPDAPLSTDSSPAAVQTDFNDPVTLQAAVEMQMNELMAKEPSTAGVTVKSVMCLKSGDVRFTCRIETSDDNVNTQDVIVAVDGSSFVAASN